jgi:two-component system phosphate regulon sensor histidine kinase PhoR
MNWLWPRVIALTLVSIAGAVFGGFVWPVDAHGLGVLVGLLIGLAGIALRDLVCAHRLISWLRGSQELPAPRSAGLWGELAYRIERSIRLGESSAALERERLRQFLSAIEASPNGVMLLDERDQIDWCNSLAADHFGLDPQRDRRQPVTNLVRAPAFVGYLQAGRFDEAITILDSRGRQTLSVLVRRYGDDLKLVMSQDITERERSEGMRRDFVANVSHEIRTPLTVLAGFIETMASLPLTDAERTRVLALMAQQTDRMGTLVADLLTLAQLEGSPRPNGDRWVALAPLLAQVQTEAGLLSAGRHTLSFPHKLEVELAGAANEVLSAVTNLVNNAVRYTPEGGKIDVTWRTLPDGRGEIVVSDTGLGIAREHLPRLTERFYRVDGSRSRDTGGTGLGLSIVKHVMQRHGGELGIQSEPGKGSSFRLVFPAVRVRAVSTDATASVERAIT